MQLSNNKVLLIKNGLSRLAILSLFLMFCSCNNKSQLEGEIADIPFQVSVDRFDQIFMNSTPETFPKLKLKYPFLFPNQIHDSVFLKRISDPIQKLIRRAVDSVFNDFSSTEKELISLFKHIKYYNPSLKKPRIITLYSDVDYRNKVIVTDSIVLISIDNYLGSNHEFYDSFYTYIKKTLRKDQIVIDLADAYAERWINQPRRTTFLEELIYQGKKLYLKEIWVPTAENHVVMGYTTEEWQWAIDNEFYIWEYFIENELLYSTDPKLVSRFIEPAPFSRFNLELDSESPGALGKYIGWQIVKSFVKNNDTSILSLLQMDAQTLFNNAKFKPKR